MNNAKHLQSTNSAEQLVMMNYSARRFDRLASKIRVIAQLGSPRMIYFKRTGIGVFSPRRRPLKSSRSNVKYPERAPRQSRRAAHLFFSFLFFSFLFFPMIYLRVLTN